MQIKNICGSAFYDVDAFQLQSALKPKPISYVTKQQWLSVITEWDQI